MPYNISLVLRLFKVKATAELEQIVHCHLIGSFVSGSAKIMDSH